MMTRLFILKKLPSFGLFVLFIKQYEFLHYVVICINAKFLFVLLSMALNYRNKFLSKFKYIPNSK